MFFTSKIGIRITHLTAWLHGLNTRMLTKCSAKAWPCKYSEIVPTVILFSSDYSVLKKSDSLSLILLQRFLEEAAVQCIIEEGWHRSTPLTASSFFLLWKQISRVADATWHTLDLLGSQWSWCDLWPNKSKRAPNILIKSSAKVRKELLSAQTWRHGSPMSPQMVLIKMETILASCLISSPVKHNRFIHPGRASLGNDWIEFRESTNHLQR
jgi:hypothetical protein